MRRRVLVWAFLAAALGCWPGRTAPAGTGAEAVVHDFYQALVRGDVDQAYADLHPDSRAIVPPDAFAGLARDYRAGLGFEPGAVLVRSCDEQGDQAVAHVVLTGRLDGREHRFTDGATLRRTGAGWGVVLPLHFGRPR